MERADRQIHNVKQGHIHEEGSKPANYYMYSGQASSLVDASSGLGTLSIDWTESDSKFGFFSVYSDKDQCANKKTMKSLDFGSHKTKKFSKSKVEILEEPRSYIDEKTIKLPSTQIEIQSEKTEIKDITGALWFDKFDRSNDADYIAAEKAGKLAINVLGFISVFNTVFVGWVWQTFLLDHLNNTDFWYAWFGPYLLNGVIWIPLTVVWPITPFGETTMLMFLKLMAQGTYIGTFIGYWANTYAMYYAFYMEPTKSDSTFATTEEAAPYLGGYIALSLVDSIASLLFAGDVIAYYNKVKEADRFKKAIKEAAIEAQLESESYIALI